MVFVVLLVNFVIKGKNFSHNRLLYWKTNDHPANENKLNWSELSWDVLKGACRSAPAASMMAVNPLEGLISVAMDQQLGSSSTAEQQVMQPVVAHLPASLPRHRQSAPSRKWVSLVWWKVKDQSKICFQRHIRTLQKLQSNLSKLR